MYRKQELGALVRVRPEEAKQVILLAFQDAQGWTEGAATILGVGERSLTRWVGQLGLREAVAAIRARWAPRLPRMPHAGRGSGRPRIRKAGRGQLPRTGSRASQKKT